MAGRPPGGGWHTGSLDAGTGGVRDGYKPDFGTVPQAEYSAQLEKEAAAKKGRLARIGRALRRFFWEF
ncbi:MAG: hypothetical protein ACXWWU_07335 [Candidatus Limnocylindria bacterium]